METNDGDMVVPVLSGEDPETHAEDRGMMVPILVILAFVVGYGVYYEMFVAEDEPVAKQPAVEQPSDASTPAAPSAVAFRASPGTRLVDL